LSDGTAYYYRISSYNSGGEGSQSNVASATTQPVAPTGVAAAANSATSITIGWSAVTGATGYRVYRSTASGTYEQVGTATSTTYTNASLTESTTYYYKVAAYNSGGEGSQSSYATATTRVGTPTGVTAAANSTSSITVSWSSVAGADGYRIYRSTASSGTYIQVGTSETTSYENTGLTANTAYYYKVSAYSSGGEGSQSDAVSATTKLYGTVSYEGQNYKTVVIGTQTWMAENLNYNASGSKCYNDDTGGDSQGYCATYGRLYSWATAKTVCPTGWHLPSAAEWSTLISYVDGSFITAGTKLKAASGWNSYSGVPFGTDEFGFAALPGGSGGSSGSSFGVGNYGYWWSATGDANHAYYRIMLYNGMTVNEGSGNIMSDLFSVRCVMD
jgi:uncharacterized protein (TIGR02145 family)